MAHNAIEMRLNLFELIVVVVVFFSSSFACFLSAAACGIDGFSHKKIIGFCCDDFKVSPGLIWTIFHGEIWIKCICGISSGLRLCAISLSII